MDSAGVAQGNHDSLGWGPCTQQALGATLGEVREGSREVVSSGFEEDMLSNVKGKERHVKEEG